MLSQARCQLGNKYGALQEDCAGLLATAKQLNINVVGVAFHVGSGATNPHAFADAIAAARQVCLLFVSCPSLLPMTMFELMPFLTWPAQKDPLRVRAQVSKRSSSCSDRSSTVSSLK